MLQVIQFSFSLWEIGLSGVWEILVYKKAWLNHIHYRLEFDSHFVADQPYLGVFFCMAQKALDSAIVACLAQQQLWYIS
jgi:hypothetical protein